MTATDRVRADVAKCQGERCDIRELCDRFVRRAAERQTFLIVPEHERGRGCRFFRGREVNDE